MVWLLVAAFVAGLVWWMSRHLLLVILLLILSPAILKLLLAVLYFIGLPLRILKDVFPSGRRRRSR